MASHKLVTCPYDEVHKVKESRLQLHITKCRMNHLNEQKFQCPFNATHVFPMKEKTYHLLHCQDRAPLDRQAAQLIDKHNPNKGRTAVPSYSASPPVVSEEVWDIDYNSTGPGYRPPSEPPIGAIVEPPALSKPAERRQLYQELHRMPTDSSEIKSPKSPPKPAPKQYKQPSEPSKLQTQIQSMQGYQNLGLGRGRGAPPTRIAANIFPAQVSNSNYGQRDSSYSGAISAGLSQLGIGRGHFNQGSAASMFNNENDFPALGLGRALNRNPKNAVQAPGNR